MKNKDLYILLFLLAVILALAFLITTPAYAETSDFQEYWDLISKYSPNDCTTAAVMGWFFRESKFKANGVTGWPSNPNKHASEEFTEQIDAGLADGSTKDLFIKSAQEKYGGYGLGQFSSACYLEALYEFAVGWGTSIGDPEMQIAFTFDYLQEVNPWNVWSHLEAATDPYATGYMIGKYVDGTLLPESIASYSQDFYNKYAGGENEG